MRIGSVVLRSRTRRELISSDSWSPLKLGSSVLAYWDAAKPGTLTLSAGRVTSWKDSLHGYDAVQGTDANRPTYDPALFNGYGGLTFNGTSSVLTLASQPFPATSVGCEIWAVADQQALIADATSRTVFSYGGNASATARNLRRAVSGGVSVAAAITGTGAAATTALGPNSTQWTGRSVVRGTFSPTTVTAYRDGVAGTPAAAVPSTGTTRAVIGAATTDAPAAFWHGAISAVLVTTIGLTTAEVAMLITDFNRRLV